MNIKKSVARLALLGIIVATYVFVSSKPASASTTARGTVQFSCKEAQREVNFLLDLDERFEDLVAANPGNTSLAEEAAELDQYINDAIEFVESHTAAGCTFASEDE